MNGFVLLRAAIYLTAGNWMYQILGPHDWMVALERSYFQCFALLFVYFYARLDRWMNAA